MSSKVLSQMSNVGLETKLLPVNIWKGVTQMLLSLSTLEALASGAIGAFLAQALQMCCGLACFSESAAGWTWIATGASQEQPAAGKPAQRIVISSRKFLANTWRWLWSTPRIHSFDTNALSLCVPLPFLLVCFEGPNWESWLILGWSLLASWEQEAMTCSPKSASEVWQLSQQHRQLALKCSHLKAPGFHSDTLLEHFPVAPSKILPFFFLTSFVWSSTPCAVQTCWGRLFPGSGDWGQLTSGLPGRGCIASLTVLGSHPQLITLILYTL